MSSFSVLLGVGVALLLSPGHGMTTKQALKDQVTNLPNQPNGVDFDQYAGYIEIDQTTGKNIFYWLQMSDNHEERPPVVIWTNGGPGCSGLLGAMLEHGAFRIQQDQSLLLNPGRWNQLAHMVYIEQPAGVGYSYATDSNAYNTGDAQSIVDMYAFIQGFFEVFPDLKANDFYITSESYGGHYMPQLAKYIVDNNDGSINFKGFMVGNPLTDPVENAKGMYDSFYGHSIVSKPLFQSYQSACDDGNNWDQSSCQDQMGYLEQAVGDVYLYGIDWPVCPGSNLEKKHFVEKVLKPLGRGHGFERNQGKWSVSEIAKRRREHQERQAVLGDIYDPCQVNYTTAYLNRADVQSALHAQSGTVWEGCSSVVSWNATDINQYMEPYYQYLIDGNYGLHILVYSGDDDTVCGTLGTQSWIWNLGYEAETSWSAWMINEPQNGQQVGGYWVRFKHGSHKAFTFVTAHSAGHQVPWYKPSKALEIFKNYLEGEF